MNDRTIRVRSAAAGARPFPLELFERHNAWQLVADHARSNARDHLDIADHLAEHADRLRWRPWRRRDRNGLYQLALDHIDAANTWTEFAEAAGEEARAVH